jgi:hypothetical protein
MGWAQVLELDTACGPARIFSHLLVQAKVSIFFGGERAQPTRATGVVLGLVKIFEAALVVLCFWAEGNNIASACDWLWLPLGGIVAGSRAQLCRKWGTSAVAVHLVVPSLFWFAFRLRAVLPND